MVPPHIWLHQSEKQAAMPETADRTALRHQWQSCQDCIQHMWDTWDLLSYAYKAGTRSHCTFLQALVMSWKLELVIKMTCDEIRYLSKSRSILHQDKVQVSYEYGSGCPL